MPLRSLLFVTLLPVLCVAQKCDIKGFQFNPDKPLIEQNGKTKSTSPGLGWLSQYMLPVPKSAYDVDQVARHTSEQNSLNDLL